MMNKNERISSSSSSPPLECDVGLGLKMQLQPTCKDDAMALNLYHCAERNASATRYAGDGSSGPFFTSTSNQLANVNGIYEFADSLFAQRSFHSTAFGASEGGGMAVTGKALFTASQWQELERQKLIHKYMMASIPVPPELLLLPSTAINSRSPAPPTSSLSQCNTSGLDLRFASSGSDPEPWRCKRTDGKKWRCSRDVAPDQKYCERHAHKTRPRSRKHVEISPHNTTTTAAAAYSHKPLILPNITTLHPLHRSTSAASYDQTRCIEWFMRGDSSSSSSSNINSVSTCKQQQQQWEQLMQSSSNTTTDHNKNVPLCQPPHFMGLNPYTPDTYNNNNEMSNGSILDSKTTRHFIDAWGDKECLSSSSSLSKKFSPRSSSSSSLTLSMSNENCYNLGIGMISSSDRDHTSDGILKNHQWLNPGGPLGEALGLGNASTTTRDSPNLASPHHHGHSNSSKSSCGDGSHALNFIG